MQYNDAGGSCSHAKCPQRDGLLKGQRMLCVNPQAESQPTAWAIDANLVLKTRRVCCACRLGHDGVESVLDMLGDLKSLPESLVKSIQDNFRAMLSQLEVECNLEISKQYIYNQCPDCCELHREEFAGEDTCPTCASPRYEETANG